MGESGRMKIQFSFIQKLNQINTWNEKETWEAKHNRRFFFYKNKSKIKKPKNRNNISNAKKKN